jgi:plasmid stabilization system protein ParE
MDKKYRVDLSAPAEADLYDIVSYIAIQFAAPMTATKMMETIENAMSGLEFMPERFALVADERLAAMGYRKLTVKNYIVFFTITEKDAVVDVERILHAKRDWANIL